MPQQKCCTCNGANAKCIGCKCARLKVKCTSCYPLRNGRCNNTDSSAEPEIINTIPNSASGSNTSSSDHSNLATIGSSQRGDAFHIREVVKLLRQNRSSLLRHIPKGSRYSFARVLASSIETALRVNDSDSWTRLLIFPTICLRAPVHNGKRHSKSLSTLVNQQIVFFETTSDTTLLLKSIDSAKTPPKTSGLKRSERLLRKLVSDKLNDGDVRGAVRHVSSDDGLAPYSPEVLSDLLTKHPKKPSNRRSFPDASDCTPPVITPEEIAAVIKSFPLGSSGGITRLRPQHLKEAIRNEAGDQQKRLLQQLTYLINVIISNKLPTYVSPILLGANITALNKKDGGIRPIAVGETIRRIACKCALKRVEKSVSKLMSPFQFGCGVRAGIDAAIHSMRNKITLARDTDVLLKLDLRNAFNTIRRDHIADCLSKYAPDLLSLFSACYSESSFLAFGHDIIFSEEGLQQGDPLAPLYFCLGLHDILLHLRTPFKIAYLDDVALLGDPDCMLDDVNTFISDCENIGLTLNSSKCELTFMTDVNSDIPLRAFRDSLPNLRLVNREDITLLGAALGEASLDVLLKSFIATFSKFHELLLKLPSHDALFLLRNCLAIPKLLHTLRTSPSFQNSRLLSEIDSKVLQTVSSILNIKLEEEQKIQISLPTKFGGFGIVSANFIASSAFVSSLHAADPTCRAICSEWCLQRNTSYLEALSCWEDQCPTATKPVHALERQKSWTTPLHKQQADLLLSSTDDNNRARLLACKAHGSGDWLNALPSTSLGLHLNDDQLRTASSVRLGAPVSLEHVCSLCGSLADGHGRHAFSCPRSAGRHLRHRLMNEVISRALHAVPIPTRIEPAGLLPDSNLKPDGISIIPWTSGKPLVWDVTCAHPLAQSWTGTSRRGESAVATTVEAKKRNKYKDFENNFHFEPVSMETLGGMGETTALFIKRLGKRIADGTGDTHSVTYLRQRLAIAVQVGNYACLAETLPSPGSSLPPTDF